MEHEGCPRVHCSVSAVSNYGHEAAVRKENVVFSISCKNFRATSIGAVLYTIGHGSRTAEEFVTLLREAGIRRLADVRAQPASRRYPHFCRHALDRLLMAERIRYVWEGRAAWREPEVKWAGPLRRERAVAPSALNGSWAPLA